MAIGARRGELCALRWSDLRWSDSDLQISQSYVVRPGKGLIKPTRTHQSRRLAIDDATISLLREHRERCEKLAEQVGGDTRIDARRGWLALMVRIGPVAVAEQTMFQSW